MVKLKKKRILSIVIYSYIFIKRDLKIVHVFKLSTVFGKKINEITCKGIMILLISIFLNETSSKNKCGFLKAKKVYDFNFFEADLFSKT